MPNFKFLILFISLLCILPKVYSQNWKQNIAPMIGYRGIFNENSIGGSIHMLEVGAAYITGTKGVSSFLWRPTLGWRYFAPVVSLDAKFRIKQSLGSNSMMINVGVTAGAGGFFASLLPTAINGIFTYSTDFKNSYLRMGIAYDLCYVSIGGGVLSNLNGGQFITAYDNQLYMEVRLLLWKNAHY